MTRLVRVFAVVVAMLALCGGVASAKTDTPISDRIADSGLAATLRYLEEIDSPNDNERFALGSVGFLAAIENALQIRYRAAIGTTSSIPILRLPVPRNRNPIPFEPEMIVDIFAETLEAMKGAEEALAGIKGEVRLPVDITDLWLDINENGTRDPSEDLLRLTGATLGARFGRQPIPEFLVQFDTADVSWLRAYTNLLSGISEVILAYDPTTAIATVIEASEVLMPNQIVGDQQMVDQVAMIVLAMRQTPDATRTRAALAHFEAMVKHNMTFWAQLAEENDNEAEWIPNPNQRSALGVTINDEVAESWQTILAEGDAVLKGKLLLSYWRLEQGSDAALSDGGINLRKMFTDPAPIDLVLWIQGAGALPYLEQGPLVDGRNWFQFLRLLGGEAALYTLWFN